MTETRRLSLERIASAATAIDPVFLDSPQFLAESLGEALDCRLVVKVETFAHPELFDGQLAATILSGGNATAEQVRQWLAA